MFGRRKKQDAAQKAVGTPADPEAFAVINRVTDSGQVFLGAFKNHPPAKNGGVFAFSEH